MIKIVTFIVILFTAAALSFILYSATGNATSPIFTDPQLDTYLDKLNINSYNQNLASNPYGEIVSSDKDIIQYEISYTSSDII
jgi:hypothetical protein